MPVHNRYILEPNGDGSPGGLVQMGAFHSIEIHVPPQIADLLTAQGQPVPPPQSEVAIIDTGATFTAVHEPLLQALGLHPIGVVNTGTANGPVQQNTYAARVVLPVEGITGDIHSLTGVNLANQIVPLNPPQPLIALLGRDFLQRMVLIWNGPAGMWTLSL